MSRQIKLFKKIKSIAEENKQGFTYNILTQKFENQGFCVAYKETQNSFDDSGLEKALNHAITHNNIIGGWFNEKNNKFYFDSVQIIDNREEAIKIGKKNNQLAIFDLNALEEIEL